MISSLLCLKDWSLETFNFLGTQETMDCSYWTQVGKQPPHNSLLCSMSPKCEPTGGFKMTLWVPRPHTKALSC